MVALSGLTEATIESNSKSVISVQEVPDDCDSDCKSILYSRYCVFVLTSTSR